MNIRCNYGVQVRNNTGIHFIKWHKYLKILTFKKHWNEGKEKWAEGVVGKRRRLVTTEIHQDIIDRKRGNSRLATILSPICTSDNNNQ